MSETLNVTSGYPTEAEIDELSVDALKLVVIIIATLVGMILVIELADAATLNLRALFRNVREGRERRRAAKDEENAVELAAWSELDVVGAELSAQDSSATLCVPEGSNDEHYGG